MMDLLFVTDALYVRVEDGNVYSLEDNFAYLLYQRYMNSFDRITIMAQVKEGTGNDVNEANCVTRGNVDVFGLPYYVGFNGYLRNRVALKRAIKSYLYSKIDKNTAVICRIPGRIGTTAISFLDKKHIPYGVEVVGDAYDVQSKGATKYFLRPIIRILSYFSLKRLCKKAPAALYVTKHKLQERYPNPNFQIGVPDVVMPKEAFVDTHKTISNRCVELIAVDTLEQGCKAANVVVDALKLLSDKGLDFHLTWVGDGKLKNEMIQRCRLYGLQLCVDFIGKVDGGAELRKRLDEADIFLMPSRTEGLPRTLIEAMARALPCIATDICGISELLDSAVLVPVNKPRLLAEKVIFLIQNIDFAAEQSKRNLEVARTYSEEELEPLREKFYSTVKKL